MPEEITQHSSITLDHDLLIRLDEKVDNKFRALEEKIDNLSDNLVDRVNDLEDQLKDYRKTNDSKVANLQRLVYIGLGIVLSLQFVMIIYVTYFGARAQHASGQTTQITQN
jgi:hypothetical protein